MEYIQGKIISKDGTEIGYLKIGAGPALILVQGATGTNYNYDQLARALASYFTAYLPERRGRGISPKAYDDNHSINRDVEDIESMIATSGAKYVFGLSSGALIALQAARQLVSVEKVAVYEPPFQLAGVPHALVVRFNKEVAGGSAADALVTANKIVKLGPPILAFVPRIIQKRFTKSLLASEKNGTGKYYSMADILPTMQFDMKVMEDLGGEIDSFALLQKPVLLLGGTKSPRYLTEVLDRLEKILPNVRRVRYEGLDHSGSWNVDKGGDPQRVASSLQGFFLE